MSRVACETCVTMGVLIVGGEVGTRALFGVAAVVRDLGNEMGYASPKYGFDVMSARSRSGWSGSPESIHHNRSAAAQRRAGSREAGWLSLSARKEQGHEDH